MAPYGGKGIIFVDQPDPMPGVGSGMPYGAWASLTDGPPISNATTWAKWVEQWPEGFVSFQPNPCEDLQDFKSRIIITMQGSGDLGHIVWIWWRSGFWAANKAGKL